MTLAEPAQLRSGRTITVHAGMYLSEAVRRVSAHISIDSLPLLTRTWHG